MIHGLMWFPLLGFFIWLAWLGWHEYQKVEVYRNWAKEFERAKYDIYAVLGQKNSDLTWGKPTPSGIVNLQTFSLKDVTKIRLLVDSQKVELETPPSRGKAIALEFILPEPTTSIQVPFTEIPLAVKWGKFLQEEWQRWHVEV
ncbi:MAG TPA: hypothetical protein DEG17_24700 [Cyanobacteria bacterium UBA11149]|nr:hypothetical protein [Cyanobacteria bacterium UBA11367]HBE56742.1 hypothetical protein [Cyanobacteria bacterium UBA11366]HBK65718.1 hypothetical protein [Cyanobacteria bacterium UBA11166]HBR76233.1 hypothetical protein [Cyanobacteria bacterium UBA11159]HBS71296.1 hypothetical protein [Cyanobacteria bacterium UBA11153]HBW91979.1 hypothetical protein [Cyanobacteria bacterium UBA11149]HCA96948.1 hypothetical protein [Cyanobacteria bacterium UBA9226]